MALIRPLAPGDRAAWERLHAGYAAFYGTAQTAQMRARVWGWLETGALEGLVAEAQGALVGLAHLRPFLRPLSATTGGHLDDLFVVPEARGAGVARALLEAAAAHGRARGWSVLRWITAADNARARALYDRVAQHTAWQTYDIAL